MWFVFGILIYRVGQNHKCTVYVQYFWQGNHQIYGLIRCTYTVLANPTYICAGMGVGVGVCGDERTFSLVTLVWLWCCLWLPHTLKHIISWVGLKHKCTRCIYGVSKTAKYVVIYGDI